MIEVVPERDKDPEEEDRQKAVQQKDNCNFQEGAWKTQTKD